MSAAVVLSACGGGSPTSPAASPVSPIQSHLNGIIAEITINGASVPPAGTATATVGSTYSYRITLRNDSGEVLNTAIVIIRDDGVESALSCGTTPSNTGNSTIVNVVSNTIPANHAVYTPGHTVKVMLYGAYASNTTGQCYFGTLPSVNHANVQAERLLVTLTMQ